MASFLCRSSLLLLLCGPALGWETCFSYRSRLATVCDLPPTYALHKQDTVVGVYPRPGKDVWKDGVVVREFPDPPLFTIRDCRDARYQRAPTAVVIRCATAS